MAKKKRKTRKKKGFELNQNVIIALIIGLFIYFGLSGIGFNFQFPEGTQPPQSITPTQQANLSTCSAVCREANFLNAYDLITACRAGETQVNYGFPGQQPLLQCCCFNTTTPPPEPPPETPPTYSVGDVITTEEVTQTFGQGINGLIVPIELGDIELGGDCYLGVKIDTDWSYATPETCTGIQGSEGLFWHFDDSHASVWWATDTVPQAHHVERCPLYYDGSTDWALYVDRTLNLYPCVLNTHYKVVVYVCECND